MAKGKRSPGGKNLEQQQAFYQSKIDNIITNFDGYDYYLYYSRKRGLGC